MNQNAQRLLKYLCAEYDYLSQKNQARPFPEFSETIQNELGYCLVRCPLGSQRFSIVSVRFASAVRGQGVLTAFIDYIRKHPYHYNGIEVATIENKGLAKRLLSLGWQYKSQFSKIFFAKTPTLIQDFRSE